MDYQQLIKQMTPQIYRRMASALEVGRWPDGRALTAAQRESTMQAVIAWGELHLPPSERIGFIDRGKKTAQGNGGSAQASSGSDSGDTQPLNWKN